MHQYCGKLIKKWNLWESKNYSICKHKICCNFLCFFTNTPWKYFIYAVIDFVKMWFWQSWQYVLSKKLSKYSSNQLRQKKQKKTKTVQKTVFKALVWNVYNTQPYIYLQSQTQESCIKPKVSSKVRPPFNPFLTRLIFQIKTLRASVSQTKNEPEITPTEITCACC